MYAANAISIGKYSPATTSAIIEDFIRMVRFNSGAVGRSDSEVLGNSTTILQTGTTAFQAGTTSVCADFPTDYSAAATKHQTAMIPTNRGFVNLSIHGE